MVSSIKIWNEKENPPSTGRVFQYRIKADLQFLVSFEKAGFRPLSRWGDAADKKKSADLSYDAALAAVTDQRLKKK